MWIPIPTVSPGATLATSKGSSVSSAIRGVPKCGGVAAANTYSQRGVMTAVPNETSLGLTRCTRM